MGVEDSGKKFWPAFLLALVAAGFFNLLLDGAFQILTQRVGSRSVENWFAAVGLVGSEVNDLRGESGAVRSLLLIARHDPALDSARVSIPFESTSLGYVVSPEWEGRPADGPYIAILRDLRSSGSLYLESQSLPERSLLRLTYEYDNIASSMLLLVRATEEETWYVSLTFSEVLSRDLQVQGILRADDEIRKIANTITVLSEAI